MSEYQEPAIKSYFFGKGYHDLFAVIKESWDLNWASAKDYFSRIDGNNGWVIAVFTTIFWGCAGVSVVVFGTMVFVLASVIHSFFLAVFFFLIYICFTLVWIAEKIYLFFRKFFVACPACHHKTALPEYFCDKCGAVHKKLSPNSYGILFHKCECEQRLPATFFVNRGRLQARCPNPICHELLNREHIESKRIFVPVLGGPSAGKTAYMFSVVRELIDEKAGAMGYTAHFIDSNTGADFQRVLKQLKAGNEPAKTLDRIPKAFNLALDRNGSRKWMFYLYDPAGEAYQSTDALTAHGYHNFLSGMIMIVDPFSFPALQQYLQRKAPAAWGRLNPSNLEPEQALTRLLLAMEESFGLSKTGLIPTPLAVVINKIDAFGLDKVIGEPAVDHAFSQEPHKHRYVVRNELIRAQLQKWGQQQLLHQLDVRFKNVRYFTCSALGRTPDASGKDLVPNHVFEPIHWICTTVNSAQFKME